MNRFFFYILCFLELIYKAGFACFIFFKTKFCAPKKFNFKVISVGNISVGGTGKSVFVQYLVKKYSDKKCAIVLRGYKGKNEKTGNSFLVTDGKQIFCEPDFCGDEAFMLAQNLKIPIIVGSNRAKSCELLQEKFKDLDIVILDDAYQNFAVKKDEQYLLMDTRKPFENGHCLPAGMLREKDYSRADYIVLTHADLVSIKNLEDIKNNLLKDFDTSKIFSGRHKVDGLFLNGKKVNLDEIESKNFLAFAGIGSFDQFVKSVEGLGVNVCRKINYKDHYKYKIDDLKNIQQIILDNNLSGAITTQKDFVKIYPIIKKAFNKDFFPIYTLNISFEFF